MVKKVKRYFEFVRLIIKVINSGGLALATKIKEIKGRKNEREE